jgi:SulP family sulfate permease
MSEIKNFVYLIKTAPKSDIIILILTFTLTIVFDLVVAIEVNLVLAALLFMKRMSDETRVSSWKYDEDENLLTIHKNIRVYELSGPLFFGASDKIKQIYVKDFNNCLILKMKGVTAIDATALNELEKLYDYCQKNNVTLIFSHVHHQPLNAMKKAGLYHKVGEHHFCKNIQDALHLGSLVKD